MEVLYTRYKNNLHSPWSTIFPGVEMCRNIKTLFNFNPPANEEEIQNAALQFVRKLSGFTNPSQANQTIFDKAVEDISKIAGVLIHSLITLQPPRNREIEAQKARERAAKRFGTTIPK